MTWQGIPFKYLGAEQIQQAFLSISHIPDVVVKSDFALDTFLSGFCAGAIPAIVAIVAMRLNAKNIQDERKHQQQLSNKSIAMQIVYASRQVWINELRDTGAKFIGALTSVINATNTMAGEYKHVGSQTEYYFRVSDNQRSSINEVGLLTTKLELLLDRTDVTTKRVGETISSIRELMFNGRSENNIIEFDVIQPHVTELKKIICEVIENEWGKINDNIE